MIETTSIEAHYYKKGLYEEIVSRLTEMGVDLDKVTRENIKGVDEFHVRGAAVSKELAIAANIKNVRVLDVGCGIGGPCRMLADEFGCMTMGIDLSAEFIRTAKKLSALVGLDDKTAFVHGTATNLPFQDNSYEVVWTQHVQMNVADKATFYGEIDRVLTDGGTFIYYDIFKSGSSPIAYPVPWAGTEEISFLAEASVSEGILAGLGYKKTLSTDETANGIAFFEGMLRKIATSGPPKLGLNVLMGASIKGKIVNLLAGLKEGNIVLESGVYKR